MKDRNWLEIDINAVRYNIMLAKCQVKDKKIIGVVKANCYGLGVVIAKYCQDILDGFGVASITEGVRLRKIGIKKDILVLGGSFLYKDSVKQAVDYDLTLSVSDYQSAEFIDKTARGKSKKVNIHIAVDSGMSRWGYKVGDIDILKLFRLKNVIIKGIFSHLVKADELSDDASSGQLKAFEEYCRYIIDNTGFDGQIHILNSAGIFRYPDTFGNTVRLGIAMYGYAPGKYFENSCLKPSAKWYARVVRTDSIQEGQGVSYGHSFVADRPMNIATLAVGYADGLPRSLSGIAKVYYRGKAYPIIGRICMDQCVIALYDDTLHKGDIVEIMGVGNTPDTLAGLCETINYEIISDIGARVERYYKVPQ